VRITRGKAGLLGLVVAGALGMNLACSNQLHDQGGVAQANADYIVTYLNVDGSPNVTFMCIEGVGFASTTRDFTSLIPVPGWNDFCKTQIPADGPHVIPNSGTVHPVSHLNQ